MPFLRGKQGFSMKNKGRKGAQKKQIKTNKEGLWPSEVISKNLLLFLGGCPKFPFFDNLAQKTGSLKTL